MDTSNLFGAKKEEKKKPAEEGFDSSKIYIWLRGIESKVNNLRRELDIIKNDSAKKKEKVTKEIRTINEDLIELKRDQDKTLEKMDLIIKELKLTAGKEEVMVLKKYLDLWSPLNFVTQRDIDRLITDKLESSQKNEQTLKKTIPNG